MGIEETIYFAVITPLNVEVRTTANYWGYLITMKHPVMKGKEDIVKFFFTTNSLISYIV